MAKFSVGRLEDGEGPSSSRKPKRQRRARQTQTNLRDEIHERQREEEIHEVDEYEEEYQEFPFDEEEEQELEELEEERDNSDCDGEKADPLGPSRNGPFSLTLTDPDVFDCPICCEPLTTPVFQVCFLLKVLPSTHLFCM